MKRIAWTTSLHVITAALVFDLVLIMPNHPTAFNWAALKMLPLELPIILLGLLVLPANAAWTFIIRGALVGWLALVSAIKVADYFTFMAFDRGFNLIVDWSLAFAGLQTLSQTIGWPLALGSVILVGVLLVVMTGLLWWASGVWAGHQLAGAGQRSAYAAITVATALFVAEVGHASGKWQLDLQPHGDSFTARTTVRYVNESISTLASLRAFERDGLQDITVDPANRLSKLRDYDVFIVFIESYGRSSIDNPKHAALHVPTLQAAQNTLAELGLGMRSGWLTAAMVGGQSWLSHSTLASGRWISDQGRYRAWIDSPMPTLYRDASQAGHKTVAIIPAIRSAWPDGQRYGFDVIYSANGLGYQGPALNWITMPDQYTLSALDRLERNRSSRPPLFAQVVLVSSHAPFTPIADPLPWESLGDGSIYHRRQPRGDAPETVWKDPERVREQFRLAIDYSLKTVFDYIARHRHVELSKPQQRPALMIVLGDHEPARFISEVDGQDVPMHVIGPPELLAQIDAWGWTKGLIPSKDLAPWRMDTWRERFIATFSAVNP
jgi:energy-converting hydrogenase Eha subunit A